MSAAGTEKQAEEPPAKQPQTPPPASPAAPSVLVLDRKTVQALFAALRTSIPADVQQALLRDSLEELKFLIARQPRLSSFHHRRRESLRHPALAMTTKNYYQVCRRKRIELAVQAVAAEHLGHGQFGRADVHDNNKHQADGAEAKVAQQRESELVDLLLAEYAQSGGFQEESAWLNHHGGAANPGESVRLGASVSFGSRGLSAASGQLMGSMSIGEMRNEASFSMGESRTGAPTFFTEVGNTSLVGTGAVWRGGGSIMNHSNLPESASLLTPGRGGQSSAGAIHNGGGGGEGGNAGYARAGRTSRGTAGGAGRFFSKRHDRAGGGVGGGRGGGRGDGMARWGAEMHALVIRRAEEELKAGSGGDPYLLSSSRPVEVLLTCYGGAQRDSAVMAMCAATLLSGGEVGAAPSGSATPADADPLFNAVVEEDVRWDQLAQCYRQLLREANVVRQAAARAVAQDPLVNDVIRRFWERLTVSPAAQQAHKAQEVSKKRDAADAAAFSKRVHSRTVTDDPDEDDLDEIQQGGEDGTEGPGGGSPAPRALSRTATRTTRETSDAAPRRGAKGGGKGKKKRKTAVMGFASSGSRTAEPASTVSYYMTPLQYVYLHTRLAHVLLPDSNALDMELLYFIQEDLLVDAAYNESDPAQTLYFGEAPRLTSPGDTNGVRARGAERRRGSKTRFASWHEEDFAAGDEEGQKALQLRQRFEAVRRHGYTLTEDGGVSSRPDDNASVLVRHASEGRIGFGATGGGSEEGSLPLGGGGGSGGTGGDGGGKATVLNALPLVNMCFSISELPSLSYPQFWCSMMELADNWTCCAGHPVETAIFLWELYAEVFGHNWGTDDEALATALEDRAVAVSKAERTRIDDEVADALRSFQDLVKALRAQERHNRPMSASGGLAGLGVSLTDEVAFMPGGGTKHHRRQRGSRSSTSSHVLDVEETSADNSPGSSVSDLSLGEWNALAAAASEGGAAAGEWVYVERTGEDGVTRRFRRRVVHRKPRTRKDGEEASSSHSSSSDDFSFLLEEEVDDDGAVVAHRKRRCKAVTEAAKEKKRRGKKKGEEDAAASGLTPAALKGHQQRFMDHNPKQVRRLEVRRRVETGSSRASSLTSWSSIDDGGVEERRNGQRRRQRVRRTGPRRTRLRDDAEPDDDDDDGGDGVQHGASGEKVAGPGRAAGQPDNAAAKSNLSAEELADLQANKDWLCTVLGAKGIFLPPHMFDDPAEQVLLYELLRLTKESEARAKAGGGGGGSGGVDGLFNVGDGEGLGGTDLSRLAALLAQSAAFNIDGLDDSALMRRLLGEGGAGGNPFLSTQQLQGILMALVNGQKAGGEGGATTETEGMRARRLHLLRMLEELQARERQEQEAAARASEAARNGDGSGGAASTAAGGVVVNIADPSSMVAGARSRPQTGVNQLLPDRRADSRHGYTGPAASGGRLGASAGHSRIPSPPPATGTAASWQENADSGLYGVTPATAAERREQERLFRELESYWTDRASQRGRYRVHLTEYTAEQLDEFFAHLHLGPRQRALLLGRAPLAGGTSLVGGTLHQDAPNAGTPGKGTPHTTGLASTAAAPAAVAPVKLFTLTTEASLEEAMRESYESYISDKAFSKSNKDRAATESAMPAPSSQIQRKPASQHQALPPVSQPNRPREKAVAASRTLREPARPVVAASTRTTAAAALAAAPPPPLPPPALPRRRDVPSKQQLPSLTDTAVRRPRPPSSTSSTNSLPKV